MGISPWYKTSTPTAPLWTIQLVPDSGSFVTTGLTTGNFALLIKNLDTGVETSGVGTFSNITAATSTSPASVQYQAASGDVNVGNYRLAVLVTVANGVQPFILTETWEVVPL
jgi:hypothetical protein